VVLELLHLLRGTDSHGESPGTITVCLEGVSPICIAQYMYKSQYIQLVGTVVTLVNRFER
jgi:hypothetical protein